MCEEGTRDRTRLFGVRGTQAFDFVQLGLSAKHAANRYGASFLNSWPFTHSNFLPGAKRHKTVSLIRLMDWFICSRPGGSAGDVFTGLDPVF